MIAIPKEHGNGCHIYTPKDWIGQPIEIITMHKSSLFDLAEQETFTKRPTKIGNVSHIYLPKRLNGQKIKLTKKGIKEEVIKRIQPFMEYIEGAYLIGSCARGEQTKNSDVDILVITKDFNSMQFNKKSQIHFCSRKYFKNPNKEDVIFITNILSDARPIINRNLLYEIRKDFFNKLKDKEFRFNKQALRINKNTIHTLKIMRIFLEGYDKSKNKEEYVKEFKYPLKAKTLKEKANQDSYKDIVFELFLSIKDLYEKYGYINNKKLSIKNISIFFNISNFKEAYLQYKQNNFEFYKNFKIDDIKKIYFKCLHMKIEIQNVNKNRIS